jgi:hypothetical protein
MDLYGIGPVPEIQRELSRTARKAEEQIDIPDPTKLDGRSAL